MFFAFELGNSVYVLNDLSYIPQGIKYLQLSPRDSGGGIYLEDLPKVYVDVVPAGQGGDRAV